MKKLLILTFICFLGFNYSSVSQCSSWSAPFEFFYNTSRYEIVPKKTKWADAYNCSLEKGGHLITLEDKDESDFIINYLTNEIHNEKEISEFKKDGNENVLFWIGAFNRDSVWKWVKRDSSEQFREFYVGFEKNGSIINGYYANWGAKDTKLYYPIDYNYSYSYIALSLYPYNSVDSSKILSDSGQWVNKGLIEEYYYIIEYNCTDTIFKESNLYSCYGKPFIIGEDTLTKSGIYIDTTISSGYCDLIQTYNVEINNLDTNTYLDGITLKSRDFNAEVYEWYNCDNDSVVSNKRFNFTPEYSGDYKLKITEGGCEYVSECYYICRPTTYEIDTLKCKYESITINGEVYEDRGFYKQFLTQENFDCDSTLEINIEDIYINTNLRKQNGGIVAVQTDAEYQWYDCEGDIVIEGETGQGYFPTVDGSYKVSVSKDGCTEFTDCMEYKTETSVKDINESELFTIGTKSKVIYIDQNTRFNSIELLDLNSKSIYKTNESVQKIDIGNLPVGIYFLKIESDSNVEVFKFVVGG